jgi:hypothetical protein
LATSTSGEPSPEHEGAAISPHTAAALIFFSFLLGTHTLHTFN